MSRLYLSKPCAFLCYPLHTVLRVPPAPGLPCALSSERDNELASLGQQPAAGMRTHVSDCLKDGVTESATPGFATEATPAVFAAAQERVESGPARRSRADWCPGRNPREPPSN